MLEPPPNRPVWSILQYHSSPDVFPNIVTCIYHLHLVADTMAGHFSKLTFHFSQIFHAQQERAKGKNHYLIIRLEKLIIILFVDYLLSYIIYLLSFPLLAPPLPFVCLPQLMGTYLYLIMCLICRFKVITNNMKKYSSKMGQKTGTLTTSKKVKVMAMNTARIQECQNLNSGNRLANGP